MGLDLGFEKAGFDIAACIEIEKHCCETIRQNRPAIRLYSQSVGTISGQTILRDCNLGDDPPVLIGGPPCQSFSSAGNRAALNDPRGNLIFEYFRIVREIKPRAFVFENVGNLLTAALKHRPIDKRPGKHWNLNLYSNGKRAISTSDDVPMLSDEEQSGSAFKYLLKEISALGYSISFDILNSADFGAPQKRIRFVMLGTKDLPPCPLPAPTHGQIGKLRYVTLRDAIHDLQDAPGAHSIYTKRMADFFKKIPPGGNWRSLDARNQKAILGGSYDAGGGKTGFMRRLSWDKPCPTLTTKANRKGTALCHPDEIRPLSVREYARIQGFPDNWQFTGAMNQVYQQIGNAVPTALGFAVATALNNHLASPRRKHPEAPHDGLPLISQYDAALRKLRSYARNNQGSTEQPSLFSLAA